MTALRPFFSFYGAKYGIARRYPEPTHRTIVEPFAGSAGYSLHYPDRDVVLVDADPHVARTWSYLVGASRAEILDLPDLGPGDDVTDLAVPEGARYLIGFWLGRGKMRPGRRPSAWMLSGRYDGCAYFWGPRARERLAAQVERIRHWRVVEGGYAEAPDVAATWFVDPPYDCPAGRLYRRRPSDYAALADWCRARRGQVIACERDGAGWLPFEPLLERHTIDGRRSREAVYHQAGGELGGDQVPSLIGPATGEYSPATTMVRKRKASASKGDPVTTGLDADGEPVADEDAEDIVLEGTLVCALTGEHKTASPQEETLQSCIEQLHREYGVEFDDMERDVRVECITGEEGGKLRKKTRTVQLAVFERGKPHEVENLIRAVLIAKPGTKADQKAIELLEEVLGGIAPVCDRVFGLWTNGTDLTFRMREYHKRTGDPVYTELTDFPAPDETLEDLESAERRPVRVAAGDSLLRTFKRCHDYLYGNQNRRDAFWQLLYLIFAKILDEQSSARDFFVGATERNTEAGEKRIAARIKALFDRAKAEYDDVFNGDEKIELRDRALAYVAAELSRYSLLSTDTDAKGMAYEAITSTTIKRERGQFFTPRNIIRMMVEMVDPQPGMKILDPACGSGGFLVVALTHVRKTFLRAAGCPYPDQPVPKELKRVDPKVRDYARKFLWGIDVDPDLRKAARMNMVMNNDGHGNIFESNTLELVAAEHPDATPRAREFMTDEMKTFVKRSGGLGAFDYVFTNPPFGAKIPVEDSDILRAFDLGHVWAKGGDTWTKGKPQKKVPPEILFIEACFRFLKPGTGVMAIVLPNGILGNPGEQTEFVRWWMLRNMELLASVDLPAEAFLPQVSVQASCVFLRRRTEDELRLVGKNDLKQRPVFMAIAEKCGHGRRGETRYVRGPDGSDLIVTREVVERRERDGRIEEAVRRKALKEVADDLPWIAEQYHALQPEPKR